MLLIVDADVLIDYLGADLRMLATISERVGQVHVASDVVEEVNGIDGDICAHHGLVVVEASLDVLTAAANTRGSLSFEDRVSLLLAVENGWTCVTNDKVLRGACEAEDVAVRWGLELMLDLLRLDRGMHDHVLAVATAIHQGNRMHVTRAILDEFKRKAGRIVKGKRR